MPAARYRMEYPPIETSKNVTKVFVSFVILEVGNFKELAKSFTAKFSLEIRFITNSTKKFSSLLTINKLRWFDKRLTFANLKMPNDEKNIISRKQVFIQIKY